MKRPRFDAIVTELRRRILHDPASAPLRIELALAYAARRSVNAAIETLDELLDDNVSFATGDPALAALVEPLVDLVELEHPSLRQAAAEVLGRLRDARAVPSLVRLGAYGADGFDRSSALAALCALGPAAVPRLAEIAVSGNEQESLLAIYALGELGSCSQNTLVQLYQASVHPAAVLEAMAAAGARQGERCALDALSQGNGLVYSAVAALHALVDSDSRDAVQPLIQVLANENGVIAALAAGALGRIGDPRAVAPLRHALGQDDCWVRACAARALGLCGDTDALPELRIAMTDPDPLVRAFAAGAVLDLAPNASSLSSVALDELVALIERCCDYDARRAAIDALDRHQAGRDKLVELAGSGDEEQQLSAVLALADLDPDAWSKSAADAIQKGLRSANARVRGWSAGNLYRIGESFSQQDVLYDLVADCDPVVRTGLAVGLGDIAAHGLIDVMSLLRVLLHDPEESVRIETAAALAELGVEAAGLLGELCRDPSKQVRAEAISSLSYIGEDAVPALARFLYDPWTGKPCDGESSIPRRDQETGNSRYLRVSEILERMDAYSARRALREWRRRRDRME